MGAEAVAGAVETGCHRATGSADTVHAASRRRPSFIRRFRITDFMKLYFPTLRGWIAFLLAAFAILFFPVLRPALLVQSGVGTFLSEPATPAVQVAGAILVIGCLLACVEAFRRGSRVDKVVACIAVLLTIGLTTIGLIVEVLQLYVLSVHLPPNESNVPVNQNPL